MWRNRKISGVEYSYTEGGGVLHWSAIIAGGPFHIHRQSRQLSALSILRYRLCIFSWSKYFLMSKVTLC